MTRPYAARTVVSVDKSLAELRKLLEGRCASRVAVVQDASAVGVYFTIGGRTYRIGIGLPPASRFARNANGYTRTPKAAAEAHAAELRRLHRVLVLYLKALFESVDGGLHDTASALLPHLLLAGGRTVAEHVGPQVEAGALPSLPQRLLE